MSNWTGGVTDAGSRLFEASINGEAVNIFKATFGTGIVAADQLKQQTALVSEKQQASLVLNEATERGRKIGMEVRGHTEAYTANQIGVWGSAGEMGEVTLLALYQFEAGVAIPAAAEVPDFIFTFYGVVVMANDANVTVNIDQSSYVSRPALDAALEAFRGEQTEAFNGFTTRTDEKVGAIETKVDNFIETAGADIQEAKEKADEAMKEVNKATFIIHYTPKQGGKAVYTGEQQSPVWDNYSPDLMKVEGQTEATDVGTYEVQFTPLKNYRWEDTDDQTPKTVQWEIVRAALEEPRQSVELTYNKGSQSPTWTGDISKFDVDGATEGTAAGDYPVTITPKSNYCWLDGTFTGRRVVWRIARAVVTQTPVQSGTLTYNTKPQQPVWTGHDQTQLTLSGDTSKTDAGTYNAVFTPTENYCWPDKTVIGRQVQWKIGKAPGSVSLAPKTLTLTVGKLAQNITVTRSGTGAITAQSSTGSAKTSVASNTVTVTGVSSGAAQITVSVAADNNYEAISAVCSVTVRVPVKPLNSNSWQVIREASDGGVAANYWVVGDTKTITINGQVGDTMFTNLSIDAFIIGIDHNAGQEGGNRIHFQIGKMNSMNVALCDNKYDYQEKEVAGKFNMNLEASNYGGWNASTMRTVTLGNNGKPPTQAPSGSFIAAMPEDLKAVMKSVNKYTDNQGYTYNRLEDVTATQDYLWLPASYELMGNQTYENPYEMRFQEQYEYFRAGNDQRAYKHTEPDELAKVWLRSPCKTNYNFCYLIDSSLSAAVGATNSNYRLAITPEFAV